jgi:hypothetical protein
MKRVCLVGVICFALVACTRSTSGASGADGASIASSATAISAPSALDDEWTASDARKPALLADVDPELRAFLSQRAVKVTPEEAPFLGAGSMFRVERTIRVGEPTVDHPSFFHLVQLPGKGTRGLHNDADWEWMRASARVLLETEPKRVAYVSRYVDMLCSARMRYAWPVKSIDELQLLTSADADAMPRAGTEAEAVAARALVVQYRNIIKPLALPGDAAPWRGALFANGRHRLILRVDVLLLADGKITLTDNVLEKDAPIPGVFP